MHLRFTPPSLLLLTSATLQPSSPAATSRRPSRHGVQRIISRGGGCLGRGLSVSDRPGVGGVGAGGGNVLRVALQADRGLSAPSAAGSVLRGAPRGRSRGRDHPGRASAGDPFYSWRHGADRGLSGVSAAGPVLRETPRGGTCSTRGAKGPIVGGTRATRGIQLSRGSKSRGIAVILGSERLKVGRGNYVRRACDEVGRQRHGASPVGVEGHRYRV